MLKMQLGMAKRRYVVERNILSEKMGRTAAHEFSALSVLMVGSTCT